jgi:hypothetical protein
MNAHARTPFNDLPPAQQAGMLCNDDRFQRFAATRSGLPGQTFTTTAAAEYLRQICKISSRSELTTSETAAQQFQNLRTEFDAWIGKIASPRT